MKKLAAHYVRYGLALAMAFVLMLAPLANFIFYSYNLTLASVTMEYSAYDFIFLPVEAPIEFVTVMVKLIAPSALLFGAFGIIVALFGMIKNARVKKLVSGFVIAHFSMIASLYLFAFIAILQMMDSSNDTMVCSTGALLPLILATPIFIVYIILPKALDSNAQISLPSNASLAEALAKYKALLDDGTLSQDEYDTIKKTILAKHLG